MDSFAARSASSAWGGSQQMSAWDAIMWRAEGDPRTSSTGMLVELLDSAPDWPRFLAAQRAMVGRIPRLRERVMQPPLPLVQPAWSPDPHFELSHHVRHLDLGGDGTRDDLLRHCEARWRSPLDLTRPPWEATLVTGMRDGGAACVLAVHHALTDGMGLVQLLDLTHGETPEPVDRSTEPPAGIGRAPLTPTSLLARGLLRHALDAPALARTALGRAGLAIRRPRDSAGGVVHYGRSLHRLLGAMPPRSPLLAASGSDSRLLMLDLSLAELKAVGRATGGSVNDAYVAAVLGGLRRYHERHDVSVDRIPIAMPVSLRASGDPGGGNRFAGVRFAAPLAEPDPAVRIAMIGGFVRGVREEPAIAYLDSASQVLSRLPRPAIVELTARATAAADLQISNIPGLRRPAYLAGARVLGTYPFGPRPGVAAMVTMLTHEGRCCIGLTVDADVFPSSEVLQECGSSQSRV